MRKMKNSGVEWIGDIPANWDIVRTKNCYMHKKQIAGDEADNYERLALTLNGVIKRPKDDSTGLQPEAFNGYQVLRKNELVFKLIDLANVATSRVGYSSYEGIVSPAYIVLQPKIEEESKFGEYYFLSMWQREIFNHMGDDGVRSSLNASDLLNIPYLSFHIEEKKKIVKFLDEKCAEIDAVITKTKATIEEYKKLKQSIITEAVTKGIRGDRMIKDSRIEWIGEIPAKWGIATIGRMCFVTKLAGFEFTKDMVNNITDEGEVPIVRAQNIKMGRFLDDISEFISMPLSQKLSRCALDKKCLIITFIGAGIGEVAIFDKERRYHLAPNVAKIVINDDMKKFISEEFLLYFLMSSSGQEEVNKIKKATAQPSLSMETIRSIKCIIPSTIDEQNEIVDYLSKKCSDIDSLIEKKTALLEEMERYKKSVIYEYVTGKKEVPNG